MQTFFCSRYAHNFTPDYKTKIIAGVSMANAIIIASFKKTFL